MNLSNMVWFPKDYRECSYVAREAGEELLARLDWIKLAPQFIVDMGCGVGNLSPLLLKRYPHASVLSCDLSEAMLNDAREHQENFIPICTDAYRLPFKDNAVDLIFANFLLPWCIDFILLLREWRRVLNQDGLLLFNFLGPDTFGEWQQKVHPDEIPILIDMHEIGDLLLQEGFIDPVLDVQHYCMKYQDQNHLWKELKASGLWMPNRQTHFTMTPDDKEIEMNFEVVFAHAFISGLKQDFSSREGETRIPLNDLRRQLLEK